MNSNLDFLGKNEVNSFVYSSINKINNISCKNVMIDGREYTKWGTEQIVTFVGLIYEAKNKDNGRTERFLLIGMAKQHPRDLKHDKKIAVEMARVNALCDPCMVLYNVSDKFDNHTFKEMMEAYVNTMDLEFVYTADELKKYKINEFNDNWKFYLNKCS